MKHEPNLSYNDLDAEEYLYMFERSPKKRIYSFNLKLALRRGLGLLAFIVASVLSCRWIVNLLSL